MGYVRLEEITLPTRFMILVSHFIAVLTVVFGIDELASSIAQVDPGASGITQGQLDDYDSTKKTIAGLAYAALACFGIEFITLFMGVTIFFSGLMAFNIVLHLIGLILTILFYVNSWSTDTFIAYFVCFNAFPMLVELCILFFFTRFSFVKY